MTTTNSEIQVISQETADVRLSETRGVDDAAGEEEYYEEVEVLTEDGEELFEEIEEDEGLFEEEEVLDDTMNAISSTGVASEIKQTENMEGLEKQKEGEILPTVSTSSPSPVVNATDKLPDDVEKKDTIITAGKEKVSHLRDDNEAASTTKLSDTSQVLDAGQLKEQQAVSPRALQEDPNDKSTTMDVNDTTEYKTHIESSANKVKKHSDSQSMTEVQPSICTMESPNPMVDNDPDNQQNQDKIIEEDLSNRGEEVVDKDSQMTTTSPNKASSSRYFEDTQQSPKEIYGWEKPAWTTKALRSTGKGSVVRQGGDLQAPITHVDKSEHMDYINFDANPRILKHSDKGKSVRKGTNLARPITHIRKTIINPNETNKEEEDAAT